MADEKLRDLAHLCIEKSNDIVDNEGFVSIYKLTNSFQAEIIFRPLLVEAMLISVYTENEDNQSNQNVAWKILLDSDLFLISEEEIKQEDCTSSLPSRLRNTIAHELLHSLSFRSSEFGIELPRIPKKNESRDSFIQRIERETEKLSPLLLVSEKSLNTIFHSKKERFSINELSETRTKWGVSRQVFINRLVLLYLIDDQNIINRPCLSNIGIGIGEWIDKNTAHLLQWPLFNNFDKNIIPEFLIKLRRRDLTTISDLFNDIRFYLNGGEDDITEGGVNAGTISNPFCEKMNVSIAVESVRRSIKSQFMFIVRKLE